MATLGRRRALGQHFLRDRGIARLIAETAIKEATKSQCTTLLEIGPGQGAITLPILELLESDGHALKDFILSERDDKLALRWKEHPQGTVPFRVDAGDFLELAEVRWLKSTPLAVVSNLPYSMGTAILTRLARYPQQIPVMVLMFQAEVARRLRAEPSTKSWGSLSVWIQNRWDVVKLKSVPPGAFQPPPEVDSEVVVLTRRQTPHVPVVETPEGEANWESLLKACFAHRRKMLRSGLAGTRWLKSLQVSGVEGTKRAEALTWDEWRLLLTSI